MEGGFGRGLLGVLSSVLYSINQASNIRGFKSLIRNVFSFKDMQRRLILLGLKATRDL